MSVFAMWKGIIILALSLTNHTACIQAVIVYFFILVRFFIGQQIPLHLLSDHGICKITVLVAGRLVAHFCRAALIACTERPCSSR